MKRREFITLIGAATASVWPRAARAQQPAMPVVGYLYTGARSLNVGLPGFTRGLREAGFV